MKRLFFAACGLLLLGECAVEEEIVQDIGGAYINGVFVAYCSAEAAPVLFTKEGFPIIDDQACIPEPEVGYYNYASRAPNYASWAPTVRR